jgi:hypothetical protein
VPIVSSAWLIALLVFSGHFRKDVPNLPRKMNTLKNVLHEGGKKARERVREVVKLVRDRMGIVVY